MMQSRFPAAMASAAEMIACIEEAHQRLIEVAGTDSPRSEERDDAGDVVVLFGPLLGDPHIRSSTWSPVSPVSASVWSMRRVERSSLRTSA